LQRSSLVNLSQLYDRTARGVSVATTPTNISVAVTYNGSPEAPTNAGSYAVVATIDDPAYWGSTNGTLTVDKAIPTVTNWPTASGIIEWQALSASVLSGGGATALGSPLPGTFVFDAPATTPPSGVYTAAVSFVPTDTLNFFSVAGGTVEVAVAENMVPAVNAGLDQSVSFSTNAPWTPAELTTRGWYDASDMNSIVATGSNVSQLNDKSGNGRNLTVTGTGSPQTGIDKINSRNVIRCSGNALVRAAFPVNANGNLAIFTVAQIMTVSSLYQSLVSMDGVNDFQFQANNNTQFNGAIGVTGIGAGANLSGGPFAGPSAYELIFDRTGSAFYNAFIDGTKRTTDTAYTSNLSTSQALRINANRSNNTYLNVRIGEVILTDDVSLETRQKIEGYLAHKWGFVSKLPAGHPYKILSPVAPGIFATLDGMVSDAEGQPVTTTWTQIDGPAAVTFDNPYAVDTYVSFFTNGVYTLRLTADDGFGQSFDECVITVGDGYAVIYDGSGSTGGNVPADGNIYTNGATVTVLGNTGALVKSGYVFNDWSTTTNGVGGTAYATGATFSMPASNVTLYAQWTALPTYALTVNNGSGDGNYWQGAEVSIVADTPPGGYRFVNWTTADGGSFADANAASTVYTMPGNAATVTANFVTNNLPVVDAGPDQGIAMTGSAWTPTQISMLAWYDAADTNTITLVDGKVSQWNDKSGNFRHAAQGTAINRPTCLVADPMMNNLPSIGNIAATGKIGLNTPSMSAKNVYVVTYYKDGVDSSFDGYSTLLSGPVQTEPTGSWVIPTPRT
jgi:uncharacterized repeat protein (TIGR02543 family)